MAISIQKPQLNPQISLMTQILRGFIKARFTPFRVNQNALLKPQSKPVICGNRCHLRISQLRN